MVRTIQYEDPNKNGIGKKGLRELKGDENGPTVVPRNESGVVQSAGTATDPVHNAPISNVVTIIDNETFSETVTGADIDFSKYQHAILTIKTGTATGTPTLTVALQVKDSNGNYITHTTLTAISTATTTYEEFYYLSAQDIRVVNTHGGAGSFAAVTVELAMK
jgi:hypothetical protein